MGKCSGGKILALPLDNPLAEAFSRLEFLLDKVRSVQETVAKFPLSVCPISLWFPLYFIFHQSCSDAIEYNKSTMERHRH
ncbi:hypothetical protein OROHE_006223 [Orobanche hederae]